MPRSSSGTFVVSERLAQLGGGVTFDVSDAQSARRSATMQLVPKRIRLQRDCFPHGTLRQADMEHGRGDPRAGTPAGRGVRGTAPRLVLQAEIAFEDAERLARQSVVSVRALQQEAIRPGVARPEFQGRKR